MHFLFDPSRFSAPCTAPPRWWWTTRKRSILCLNPASLWISPTAPGFALRRRKWGSACLKVGHNEREVVYLSPDTTVNFSVVKERRCSLAKRFLSWSCRLIHNQCCYESLVCPLAYTLRMVVPPILISIILTAPLWHNLCLYCKYVHNLTAVVNRLFSRCDFETPPLLQDLKRAHGCLWRTPSYWQRSWMKSGSRWELPSARTASDITQKVPAASPDLNLLRWNKRRELLEAGFGSLV